jgi:Domain of unknown function (DUF4260)
MKDTKIIKWLRLEGLALLLAVLYGYVKVSHFEAWGLCIFLLFLPDISIIGYAVSTRVGAILYNLAHSLILPLFVFSVWLASPRRIILYFALMWLAHVGMDRALGYGLKYDDDFKHTHLGWIGKK